MISRGMGDSTVRMREYVGYIMIFMGTGLPASLSSLLRRHACDTLAVLVCHQWSYQQIWAESATIRHIPQRIYRETLILGCRLVGKNGLFVCSCRAQICNRQFQTVDERNMMACVGLSLSASSLDWVTVSIFFSSSGRRRMGRAQRWNSWTSV